MVRILFEGLIFFRSIIHCGCSVKTTNARRFVYGLHQSITRSPMSLKDRDVCIYIYILCYCVVLFRNVCLCFCLGKVFKDSFSVNEFLCHESSGGNHSQASVLEFLGLHESEFLGIFGLESKGIETDVTGKVSLTQETRLVDGDVLGFDPSNGGTLLFGGSDGDGQYQPEADGNLGQMGDGGSGDLGIEEEGRSLDGFSDEEANGGEHCLGMK